MKVLLASAVIVAGACAFAAPASAGQSSVAEPARKICVLFQQQRSGSRRTCLTESEWQERLGPDWRQLLSERGVEDDLATLRTLTRLRSEPILRECKVCIEMPPPRLD